MIEVDVLIIGAGAAGLMCAIEAAKRNKKVVIIDHSNKPGKKILMSGGGRCNFTNYYASFDNYISNNHHFYKSALSRYTQWDFINMVEEFKLNYYEKTKGQLFCKNKSKDILNILLSECDKYKAQIFTSTSIKNIEHLKDKKIYSVETINLNNETSLYNTKSLVVATGGLSIPTMGASPFGYKIAEKFGLKILPTRAGLVPFTFTDNQKEKYSRLSGISVEAVVKCNNTEFKENILFTHRGISGPAILQISSYWLPGNEVEIDILPNFDLKNKLTDLKNHCPEKLLKNILSEFLPKSLLKEFLDVTCGDINLFNAALKQLDFKKIKFINDIFKKWIIKPSGTEGYRTAEVTLGGVDVNQISSKTMECNNIKGLYFIGEVLDVTGWLGGYNFQWAWSSGWVAGQYV